MARMKRARRAAQHDPRYAGMKHDAATHTRRLAAKVERETKMKLRAGRKRAKSV